MSEPTFHEGHGPCCDVCQPNPGFPTQMFVSAENFQRLVDWLDEPVEPIEAIRVAAALRRVL